MADTQNQLWIRRGDDGAYEVAPYRFDGSTSFVTMDSCLDLQQELANISTESMKRELTLARLVAEVLAIRDRVQFLEKALDQAISVGQISRRHESELCLGMSERREIGHEVARAFYGYQLIECCPELAQYLKEKKEQ